MPAAQEQEDTQDNFLGMSDSDFANMDTNALDESPEGDEPEDEEENSEEDSEAASESEGEETDEEVSDEEEGETTDDDEEESDEESGDDDTGDIDDDSDTDSDSDTDDESDDDSVDDESTDDSEELSHKEFFEKVTAPFKANHKTVQIKSADDAIKLMQMGLGFNKRMAGLKPAFKLMKTLEKNGISEENIGFLIDLKDKNPEAIAKLLADSDIDPLNLKLDGASDYKASEHTVDDREIDLDNVVEDLKDSPHYNQTIELVSQKWDDASRQAVANEPNLLKVIDGHMANGIYDLISSELEQERVFGRLDGMSDIEAYTKVGDAIAKRGGFDHLNPQKEQGKQNKPDESDKQPNKKVAEKKRRDKRRAASPSKSAAPGKKKSEDFNPLGMSDEEYLKQFDEKFL
jgi:hypothetical protein